MRKNLIIMLLAIAGLCLAINGLTQEKKGVEIQSKGLKEVENQRINTFMVKKIIDSDVFNLKGDKLGQINNLAIDIDSGKIVYAILDFGGFMGFGDKLFPVPWKSLAMLPSEGKFFLNKSKEELEKAPALDKNKFSKIGDKIWGSDIHKYYNATDPRFDDYSYGYRDFGIYPNAANEERYKKIFDSKTIKTITGKIIKTEMFPEPEIGRAIRLLIYTGKRDILPVYLGPARYIMNSARRKKFKSGDEVAVTGSLVTIEGEPFIIAMTVKLGNEVLRLRNKNGVPAWVGWVKISD